MVSFSWPWIFLLVPLPLLLNTISQSAQDSDAIAVPPRLRDALDHLPPQTSPQRNGRILLLWVAWLSLLTAIAQPALPGSSEVQTASGRTMILAIDLSSSMERRDFAIDETAVDRLTVVKQIASEFIRSRVGDRIGLVLFASESFVASPPSFDLESIAQLLASSGTGLAGRTTAIGDAIGMAISSLRTDAATEKAVILLSDGTNNAGSVEPESAAKLAQQLGIVIHTIGLASDSSDKEQQRINNQTRYSGAAADLDEDTLKAIAKQAGGQFFRARTATQLAQVYAEIDKLEGADARPPVVLVQRQLAPAFTLSLLICSLLYLGLNLRMGSNR